ncbi:MAG: hypothetical protein WD712_00860 [Candidatus Spechtbacterales bacterium]
MIRRTPNIRIAVSLTAVLLCIFALSAFFLPIFGDKERAGEREGIFIGSDKIMTVRYIDWDSAHMLGEAFNITFVIQYRDDKIIPDIESIKNASFEPFDLTGATVYHRRTNDNVSEYIYKVELVAIRAMTGQEYALKPIVLKYEVISSGKIESADIAPQMPLQVGSYYGDNTENAYLRPPKTMFASNILLKSILFGISSILAFIFTGLLVRIWKEAPKPKIVREKVPYESIADKLAHFEKRKWDNLDSEQLRIRMRELEELAIQMANDLFGVVSPRAFWANRDPRWSEVLDLLRTSYTKRGPDSASITQAVLGLKKLLNSVRQKEGR